MKPIHALLATAATAALLTAAPTRANDWSNAVDVCQGALPSYDTALRKRPLAIANESDETAFISCSLRAPLGSLEGPAPEVTTVVILLTNRGSEAQSVSCTLVDGVAAPFPTFPPVYLPKTAEIQPDAFAAVYWFDFETEAGRFRLPNLSCALPTDTEINILQVNTAIDET